MLVKRILLKIVNFGRKMWRKNKCQLLITLEGFIAAYVLNLFAIIKYKECIYDMVDHKNRT
jgi:NADH:ubiquinone oxidoreductase subunit K